MSIEDKHILNKPTRKWKETKKDSKKPSKSPLNQPTKNLAELKPYKSSIETAVGRQPTPEQEPNKPHQGYASSIETPEVPVPQTKPISTKPPQVVAKNLNFASKNPVTAIAQKLINKFTTGNQPIHKTRQSPTPSASPTNKSTGKGQGNSR
ncbi:hypothetical protein H6P87_00851 [Rickettsia tillamookensis]|uniref:Uncharacterized protein n=1 Tax=Rickettsia tillamookensis TaxID=2761623 RepID=A0A9E6MIA2_9RICK|nr:hypothetical protein [Rickettsia tillamookensis]QQV75299.1 hypothetical protein H6P87_00851 [Rickettsia tillamookensis]